MKIFTAFLGIVLLTSCATSAPPSAVERALYQIETNRQVVVTPVVLTNATGVVVATNYYTNLAETYRLVPHQAVEQVIQTATPIAAATGQVWLVPLMGLLGALYAGWAEFRNSRKKTLNTVLSQGIEVAREVMKLSTPATEAKFVEELKSAQVDAGVKSAATEVSANKVNTAEAKASAAEIVKP